MRRALLAVVLGLAIAAPAAPAFAQSAGGSGTPTVVNFGSFAVGSTVTGNLCGLTPGSTVTANVNGTGGLTKTVDANGCVHITVQITSQTAGVLGDPVNVTLQCGINTVTAGAASGTFTETCPAAAATSTPSSSVAFTGANILRWTLAAAGLLGIGAFMVWASRRRRPTLDQ